MPRPSSSSSSQSPFQLNKKAHCHIRGKAPAILKMGKIIATMKKNWACEFFSAGSSWSSSSTSSSSLSSLSTGWSILKDSTPSFLHWPKKTRIFAIRPKKQFGRNMRQRSSAKFFRRFAKHRLVSKCVSECLFRTEVKKIVWKLSSKIVKLPPWWTNRGRKVNWFVLFVLALQGRIQ